MKTTILLLLGLIFPHLLYSQHDASQPAVEYLSGGLHFPPLIASTFEARVGFVFQASSSDLRLDIGNSIDILAVNLLANKDVRLTFGGDFFTWTALRQDENFHFPVDAVDYLFGLNLAYSHVLTNDATLQMRLRWSHISAHLVDGRYNNATGEWRDNRLPRVYSREFFEIVAAWDYAQYIRPYLGFAYVYHVDPGDLGKAVYQAGIELTLPHDAEQNYHPYLAYDVRLMEIGAFSASHSVQAGVKAGNWHGKGFNLFIAYFAGMNVHGEYYDFRTEYWGPGFTLDF